MKHKKAVYIKRFAAFFIDWYIASLFASIPVIMIQSLQAGELVIINSLEGLTLPLSWTAGVLALLFYALYYCVLPCRAGKTRKIGQTFGRQLMKIQLVKRDNSPLSYKNLLIRDFICVLLLEGYLTSTNIYIMSLIQKTTGTYVVPYFQSIYYVTAALSLLMLLLGKRNQMLHDLISKTIMVEVNGQLTPGKDYPK
ncbi:MAG: RDD family protein [Anaerocolumna sp.]